MPSGLDPVTSVSSGIVIGDPLLNLNIGSEIHFKNLDFAGSDGNSLPQAIKNPEIFDGSILALGIKSENRSQIIGSAVIIGPGLAVSATHNVQDALESLSSGLEALFMIGARGSVLDIWTASSISFAPDNDVTLISLKRESAMPEGNMFTKHRIRAQPPSIGEMLNIVGYRFEKPVEHRIQDGIPMEASFSGNMYAARGTTESFFPNSRDSVLLPFPCFQIDCGALGGMSGGAVLDDQGRLLGIVTSSFSLHQDNGFSYASWLIAGLNREVTILWPPNLIPPNSHFMDIDNRLVTIDDRERLQEVAGAIPRNWHITFD